MKDGTLIESKLYFDDVLDAAAGNCTDNRIDAEGVKADDDGGSVDDVDGDSVDDGEGGGVDDGDPKSLPCAALPRIDEVSWFRASVSGAVP